MTDPSVDPTMFLGRVPTPPDPRDQNFPMTLLLDTVEPTVIPPSRYWVAGKTKLNQSMIRNVNGGFGSCVGYTSANWIQASPIRSAVTNQTGVDIYNACKQIDGIPNQEGTYGRAALKVLQTQGRVGRYLWATGPDDLKKWILSTGPVMVGTVWYSQMFSPAPDGYVHPTGYVAGGHEYLIRGYSRPRDAYKCINSWGAGWGLNGEFWISRIDMENLVFNLGGDALGAEEIKLGA